MKKILIFFVLFSCMIAFGEEITIGKYEKVQEESKINSTSSINWTPYMQELEQTIKNNWHIAPNYNANLCAIARFIIKKDGSVDNIEIYKSSGNPLFDRSAVNAIKEVSAFKPLPKEYKGDLIPIEYTFESKVNISTVNYSSYNNELSSKNAKLLSNKNGDIYIQQPNYKKQNNTKANKKIWAPYLQKLEKTVRGNWKSPIITSSKSATVQFKVSGNGDITEVKIVNSSNDLSFDESIVNAVKNTSPAEPLPEEFEGEFFPVEFTFSANSMGNESNAANNSKGYGSPYNKHIINTYNMLSH